MTAEEFKVIITAETAGLKKELEKAQDEISKLLDKAKAAATKASASITGAAKQVKKTLVTESLAAVSSAGAKVKNGVSKALNGLKRSLKTGLRVVATITGVTLAAMIRQVFKMSGGSDEWKKSMSGLKASWLLLKTTLGSMVQSVLLPLIGNLDRFIQKLKVGAQAFAEAFNIKVLKDYQKEVKNLAGFDEINTLDTGGANDENSTVLSADETAAAEETGKKLATDFKEITDSVKKISDAIEKTIVPALLLMSGLKLAKLLDLPTVLELLDLLPYTLDADFKGLLALGNAWSTVAFDKGAGKALIQLKTLLPAVSGSILGIVAAVAAVIACIVLAYKKSEYFRDLVSNVLDLLKGQWESIKAAVAPALEQLKEYFKKLWAAVEPILVSAGEVAGTILAGAVVVLSTILTIIIDIVAWVTEKLFKGINAVLDVFSKILGIIKDIFSGKFKDAWSGIKGMFGIEGFASGGFPATGSLFLANEAGPEMVGTIGGATAVANNDQITSAIYNAVYNAMVKAGGMGGGNITVELDGQKVGKSVMDYHNNIVRRTGKSPLLA